jgi:hypothetical protein
MSWQQEKSEVGLEGVIEFSSKNILMDKNRLAESQSLSPGRSHKTFHITNAKICWSVCQEQTI